MAAAITDDDRRRAAIGQSPYDEGYGLEFAGIGDGFAHARLQATSRHAQPTGVVHGGVYAAIAEAVASNGTNWAVTPAGRIVFGLSNTTNFLRPAEVPCTLDAQGTALHQGRSTWVWDVRLTAGDDPRPVAVSRVVVAVRDAHGQQLWHTEDEPSGGTR